MSNAFSLRNRKNYMPTASGANFLTGLKAILQIELSMCNMVILNLKQKQLPMVFHKAPFWDHCYLFYMSMIFPEPQIYHSPFYLPMIPVLIEGHEYQKLIETLNEELCNVDKWLQANKLTLNIRKTHYMLFHRVRLKREQLNIYFRGETIFRVNSTKILEVIIDDE